MVYTYRELPRSTTQTELEQAALQRNAIKQSDATQTTTTLNAFGSRLHEVLHGLFWDF